MLLVKEFCSPDIDINNFHPENLEDIYFLLEFEIGEKGSDKFDIFSVVISTPEALVKTTSKDSLIISKRGLIIVSSFDWQEIQGEILAIVKNCESSSIVESTWKLQRYFFWEFEDFQAE